MYYSYFLAAMFRFAFNTVKWFFVFMGIIFIFLVYDGMQSNVIMEKYRHLVPIWEQDI